MNTVLIAEDELLIRMALESSIPWKEFNFEVVASVADGKKAWAAYQQYRPDVVLTDILMPGLDGIELIKRIRQQDAVCKIIVITCVEHFDILYKSLNLNITDYLLKSSMTRDNLFLMVSRLKSELSCSDSAEQRSDSIDLSTNDNLRLYLIERSISLQKFLSSTSTSFSAGNLYCLYVLQCGYLNSMIRQSLINIVQEHLSPKGELYTVFSNEFIYLLLNPSFPPSYEQLVEIFENIQNYMYDIFRVTFRAAFNSPQKLSCLPALAQLCESMLNNAYFFPGKYLQVQPDERNIDAMTFFDAFRTNPACYAFFEGEPAKKYMHLLDNLKANFGGDKQVFIDDLEQLRLLIISLLPTIREKALVSLNLMSFDNALDAISALWKVIPHYTPHPIYSAGILKTIRYIHEHYKENIALPDFAQSLNITANYYAVLFRQITSFSFSEFLISIRMYHAARLLKETNLSIASIAESCGFSDAAYFSHYFKKIYRQTPRGYRKS